MVGPIAGNSFANGQSMPNGNSFANGKTESGPSSHKDAAKRLQAPAARKHVGM